MSKVKDRLPEALLEMHYHHALRAAYRERLGTENFRIFKPSAREEAWYGFDQGFFRSQTEVPAAMDSLRHALHFSDRLDNFELRAFFLQFKVVQHLKRRSYLAPEGWQAPYYRTSLSLEPNEKTGLSQHETLRRVAQIQGAEVSYVCPMVFDYDDIIKEPDLADLRFVDARSAPDDWLQDEKHFLCFQTPCSEPVWASKPVPAKSKSFGDLFDNLHVFSLEKMEGFLSEVRAACSPGVSASPLPESLLVIASDPYA